MCEYPMASTLHMLSVPIMATCCGHSACYDCLKDFLVTNQSSSLTCPFCGADWKKVPKLVHNKWLHQLLAQELPKDTHKLTKEEKEALDK